MNSADQTKSRIYLTVLTGFLGAGKTTILNRYLESPFGKGTAVLVNEFGDVDVDSAIIGAASEGGKMMSLPNGCVCCEMQDDLSSTLIELAERHNSEGDISRCIIETSGLAVPSSILRTIGRNPSLKAEFEVAQTICVASAPAIIDQANKYIEAAEQIAISDKIAISKLDLIADDMFDRIKVMLRERNPMAEIMVTGIDASVDELFIPSQNLCHPIEQMIVVDDHVCDHQREHDHPHEHNHTHGIDSFSIRIDEPLDQNLFYDVLTFWIVRHSDSLLRVKGFLSFVEEPKPHLINIVHDVCNIEPLEREVQGSYLVFIGIGLPETEIRKDLETCNIQAAGTRKGVSCT